MSHRKRIYVAGPITRGDLAGNINRATAAFRELMRLGFAPLCPHWSCYAGGCEKRVFVDRFDDGTPTTDVVAVASAAPTEATLAEWLQVDLPWVAVSDAVLRLPGESPGADIEVAHAREKGVPVLDSIPDVVSHFRATDTPSPAPAVSPP
jgi:hypothetical protein